MRAAEMGYLARTLRRLTRLGIPVRLLSDGRGRWICAIDTKSATATTPTKALRDVLLDFNHQDRYLDAPKGGPDGSHDD